MGAFYPIFYPKIVVFKASNPIKLGRLVFGVLQGENTLGTKSFEEEKLEEEKEGESRREGAFTSKFVYSLPFSMFFLLLMVVITFLEMF